MEGEELKENLTCMSRRNGEHKVLDKNEMVENHLEGSLDIGGGLRMDFSKINFSLTFFPMVASLQLAFTGNHTGCEVLGR